MKTRLLKKIRRRFTWGNIDGEFYLFDNNRFESTKVLEPYVALFYILIRMDKIKHTYNIGNTRKRNLFLNELNKLK